MKKHVLILVCFVGSLGSGAQQINIGSGAKMVIGAGATVSVGTAASSGTVTNTDNAGLVIQSTSSGTGSLICGGTPNATVQRYLTDNMWHTVTPSTIGITANTFYWSDAPKAWLMYHTESTNEFTPNTSLSTSMPVGQGWFVWLDDNTKSDATASMAGPLQSADLPVTLACSGSGIDQGWNLIGNPFPCSMDRDEGSWGTNTSGAVYVWVNGDDDYRYYTSGSGGTLTGGIIPIGQGFFVKSSSAGSFLIPKAARGHSSQSFYKSFDGMEKPFVRLDLTTGIYRTVAFVGFPQEGTSEFDDNFDVDRLYGSLETPQMIIPEGDRNLCINAAAPLTDNEIRIIPLLVKFFIDGTYDLAISDLDHLPGVEILLEDLLLGSFHDMVKENSYQFQASQGDSPDRFLLHFKANPYGVDDLGIVDNDNLSIYSWGNTVYVRSIGDAVNHEGILRLFDLSGRMIQEELISKGELASFNVILTNTYLIARVIKDSSVKSAKVYIN